MMKPRPWAILLATMALAIPASAAPRVLKLDAATQTRLGITTTPLRASVSTPGLAGFVRGLDAGSLASLDADIAVATAALAVSRAEAARTLALHAADATVSARVQEAALAQMRADAARLQLLRRRLSLEWGQGLAALSERGWDQIVDDVVARRAAFVRLDAAGGRLPLRGTISLDLGSLGSTTVVLLGAAPSAEARVQSVGALALLRGPLAERLSPGVTAPATLSVGPAVQGVVIPRTALLRASGQTFVYVRRVDGSFERRAVVAGRSAPDGLVVTSGFRPGEAVIVTGAAQVLAIEASAPVGG